MDDVCKPPSSCMNSKDFESSSQGPCMDMFGYVFRDSARISGIDPSRRRGPCKEVLTA